MKILKEYYLIANDRTGDKYLIKKYTMSEEKHTFVPLNIFARNKSKILNKLHLRRCTNTTSYRSSKIRCCNSKKKKKKKKWYVDDCSYHSSTINNIKYFLFPISFPQLATDIQINIVLPEDSTDSSVCSASMYPQIQRSINIAVFFMVSSARVIRDRKCTVYTRIALKLR